MEILNYINSIRKQIGLEEILPASDGICGRLTEEEISEYVGREKAEEIMGNHKREMEKKYLREGGWEYLQPIYIKGKAGLVLEEKGYNTSKVWDQILADKGSVQNLPDDVLSTDEKEVFLTFSEVNQFELVKQAAIRQKYIDQTQSLNLSFDPTDSPKWINQVHMEAWKLGVKTLYYLRIDSVIRGDIGSRTADCLSCDG